MAVENKYVDANVVADKKTTAAFVHGSYPVVLLQTFEVAAADDDGSIYRVGKNLPPDLVPVLIHVFNDAITGGTDFDLGLYEPLERGGAAIDKDIFLDGVSMASARAHAAPLDGLTAVDVANIQKRIYEHAAHTLSTRKLGYDLAFTGNTVGTAAGTISIMAVFVQG